MESKQEVIDIVKHYLAEFSSEDQSSVAQFLENNDWLYDRKNFNGHITASAFIINLSTNEMLLLKHKLYDRYLQPGGHVEENDDTILAAALREAVEETGIDKDDLLYTPLNSQADIPFDIDSHHIPANKNKNEEEHVHHDFRYLFVCTGKKEIIVPPSQAKGFKWLPFSSLSHNEIFSLIIEKINTRIL